MGLDRGYLEGVDGYFAVLLWREYELYHDQEALETLLAYNIADTVNLERWPSRHTTAMWQYCPLQRS